MENEITLKNELPKSCFQNKLVFLDIHTFIMIHFDCKTFLTVNILSFSCVYVMMLVIAKTSVFFFI